MKIEEAEAGMSVIYIPGHAHGDRGHKDCEPGIVSSKNDTNVFVKFHLNAVYGTACNPDDLVRAHEPAE